MNQPDSTDLVARITRLSERLAQYEHDLEEQRQQIATLRATVAGQPTPPSTPAEPKRQAAATPAALPRRLGPAHLSRRHLIGRLVGGALAAGVLATLPYGSAKAQETGKRDSLADPNAPHADGQPVLLGQSNTPTGLATTSIYAPTSTTLSPRLVRIANYSNTDITSQVPMADYRIGLIVGVSGSDDSGQAKRLGVAALTDTGTGVYGHGGTYGAELKGGQAALRLVPTEGEGAPTSGLHQRGELVVDGAGNLYLCTTDGTPGSWVRLNLSQVQMPLITATRTTALATLNSAGVPTQPVSQPGQPFYTATITLPTTMPSGGTYYLSASATGLTPGMVDDGLIVQAGATEIFRHDYGASGPPAPTLVEVPSSILVPRAGQALTILFTDFHGGRIGATPLYLVWAA